MLNEVDPRAKSGGDPERALRVDAHLAAGIVNILNGWGHLVRRQLDRAGVLTQPVHATG